MSEYKVTNPYSKDELSHGLGIGGGRGRPKGSRNGFISPGAAYMKNYNVVGTEAQQVPNGQNPQGSNVRAPATRSSNAGARTQTAQNNSSTNRTAPVVSRLGADNSDARDPAAATLRGKDLIKQLQNQQIDVKPIDVKPISTETIIPEQIIKEDVIREQGPAQENQETPEQKSWWDNFLSWGDQALKDIGNTVSGAWNTSTKAISDASSWVNDNILKPVGDWGNTALKDVSDWMGERGKDIDRLWNAGVDAADRVLGTDLNKNGVTGQPGWQGAERVLQPAVDWVRQAGQTIGDTANRVWNGDPNNPNDGVGGWLNRAGQDVGNFAGRVWNGGVDAIDRLAGTDLNNNGVTGQPGWQGAQNVINRVGEGINRVGEGIGNWWNGTDETRNVGRQVVDENGKTRSVYEQVPVNPGFYQTYIQPGIDWARQAGQDIGNAAAGAWNGGVDALDRLAGTDLNNNGVTGAPGWQGAENLANQVGQGINNAAGQIAEGAQQMYQQAVNNSPAAVQAALAGVSPITIANIYGRVLSGELSQSDANDLYFRLINNPRDRW